MFERLIEGGMDRERIAQLFILPKDISVENQPAEDDLKDL